MTQLTVEIKRLENNLDQPLPAYGTPNAAGMDLIAVNETPITLEPGKRTLIPTGLAIALPNGYEAQIRPRSGLALKNGLLVLNTPGTIDSDYRGEIKIILANFGEETFTIEKGMKIAQMVVTAHSTVSWTEVQELDATTRGTGGFGSTGVKAA